VKRKEKEKEEEEEKSLNVTPRLAENLF